LTSLVTSLVTTPLLPATLHHRFGAVWRVATDSSVALPSTALPPIVTQRAARFTFADDAAHHLAAHRALQAVLEVHAPDAPGPSWRVDARGKPFLEHGPTFNLSRRRGWCAFVIDIDTAPCGIDFELTRKVDDAMDLAGEVFTRAEIDTLAAASGATDLAGIDARSLAFLRGWTRKEAVLKAVGFGLGLEPRLVHVGLEPTARRVRIDHEHVHAWVEVESLPEDAVSVWAVARVVDGS
jgi:4'-phosphopantetheinyl transferase